MIIKQQDIDEFEAAYKRFCPDDDDPSWEEEDILEWLVENPQVVLAAGYQEFVAGAKSSIYKKLVRFGELDSKTRPLFRHPDVGWIIPSTVGTIQDEDWSAFRLEALMELADAQQKLYDDMRTIGWKNAPSDFDDRQSQIDYRSVHGCVEKMPSYESMIEMASKFIDNPLVDKIVLVSPRLWTPTHQSHNKNRLQSTAVELIKQLKEQKIELNDVRWQDFEEIVAEVLRQSGMEVHLVKENPQGGRDIIARTEFCGEVLNIAVEVKHRECVDRPELDKAIEQNRHFPALMLVSSGTFTAGVRKVVSRPENKMRIFLRNGIAIRDLIRNYRL